jgi:hypothetical protein
MLARIRKFLASTPYLKIGEHVTLSFVGAFGLAAVATAEHAASTHGFSLSWSFIAAAAAAGLTAGYHQVRPLLLKTVLGKLLGAPAAASTTVTTSSSTPPAPPQ